MKTEKDESVKLKIFDQILDAEFRFKQTPDPITPLEKSKWTASLDTIKNTRAIQQQQEYEERERKKKEQKDKEKEDELLKQQEDLDKKILQPFRDI